MSFDRLFQKSQLITEKLLKYLDAKSLAHFGSCSRNLRSITNSQTLWHRLCKLKSYEKYYYLLDTNKHPSIPARSTSALPTFQPVESETLEDLNEWRQLYNRVRHLRKNWTQGIYYVAPVLRGHSGQLTAFDSNGEIAVSGSSDDRLLKVWSLNDCECLNNIKSKSESINCLKIVNDLVLTAGDDGIIFVYSIQEGTLIKTLANNNSSSGGISKFTVNQSSQLIAAHSDRSLRVWSLKTFELQFVLRDHDEDIECLESYQDFVISGSWDQSVVLWELEHGRKLVKLTGHAEVVNCMKMAGNRIISGSSDATLRIWELILDRNEKTNKRIGCLNTFTVLQDGHKSDILCVETWDDYVVSAGADSMVIVWNMAGDLLHRLGGHLGNVRYIYIDEFKCVTGGDAKRIMVWDYKSGKKLNTLHRNPNLVKSMWVNDTKIITTSPETNSGITIVCYW